jgi:hypothetical protein
MEVTTVNTKVTEIRFKETETVVAIYVRAERHYNPDCQ